MIARINHEHAEREKLEQARQELLKRKQALIAENKKRKDDLASLDQDLEKFIDVSPLAVGYNGVCSNRIFSGSETDSKDLRKRVLTFMWSFGHVGVSCVEGLGIIDTRHCMFPHVRLCILKEQL